MNNITNFSEINTSNRLDAEYFQKIFNNTKTDNSNLKYAKLVDLCEFIKTGPSGSILSASKYKKRGVKIIRPSNLDGWGCGKGSFVFIDPQFCIDKKIKFCKKGDILLSRIGDIKCGIIEDGSAVISPNLIVVRVKKEIVDPLYLLAFLNSQNAMHQLSKGVKKMSLSSVDTRHLSKIIVPVLPINQQKNIGQKVKKAISKKHKAIYLYAKADEVLSENLIYEKNKQINVNFIINMSQLNAAKRADTEFFINDLREFPESVEFIELKDLGIINRGIEPGRTKYESEGFNLLRPSNIDYMGLIGKSQKFISKELYKKLFKKYKPVKGEILFAKDGKTGASCLLIKNIKGIISAGVVRIKIISPIYPEYVALCLRSEFCLQQIRKNIDGSLVPHLKVESLNKLLIPIFDSKIQKKIAIMVKESYRKSDKAMKILNDINKEFI